MLSIAPSRNTAGAANIGSGVTAYNAAGQVVAAGTKSIVAYVANNPNARYVQAGLGALSNTGRNTFPLDHTNNFDASAMKRFNITESKRLEFGAQAFNLFNHSQFVGGYLSDVSSFGTAAISRNFLLPSNANFGHYQAYFSSNSRTMQLVARISLLNASHPCSYTRGAFGLPFFMPDRPVTPTKNFYFRTSTKLPASQAPLS